MVKERNICNTALTWLLHRMIDRMPHVLNMRQPQSRVPDMCVFTGGIHLKLCMMLFEWKQVHYIAAEEEYLPLREKSVDGMPRSGFGIAKSAYVVARANT